MKQIIRVLTAPAIGPACVLMGMTMCAFGLPFLYPHPEAFRHVDSPYIQMKRIAPHFAWGLLFVSAGGWRVVAAIYGTYRQRTYSTTLAIALWCFLFLNFFLAEPSSPGVTVFAAWTALESWTLFRIRRHPVRTVLIV